MPMTGFVEMKFVCALCNKQFEALSGVSTPPQVVCMDCGLRYSPEKLRALLAAKAKQPPIRRWRRL